MIGFLNVGGNNSFIIIAVNICNDLILYLCQHVKVKKNTLNMFWVSTSKMLFFRAFEGKIEDLQETIALDLRISFAKFFLIWKEEDISFH